MPAATLEVISLIVSLLQVVNRATAEVATMSALLDKAKAEGRDISDAELDECRKAAVSALARLA
jgi:hypothetical protein